MTGLELHLLPGVRPDLAQTLRQAGHRVRIYVPCGRDVFPCSGRRLRENPAADGHVARVLAQDLFTAVRSAAAGSLQADRTAATCSLRDRVQIW